MVLTNRATRLGDGDEAEAEEEGGAAIDEAYRPQVLDLFGEEEMADYAPTGPVDQAERVGINYDRRRLILLGNRARALAGPKEDWKLARLIEIVRDLAEGRVAPDCFLPVYPDSLLCGHACTEITGPRICRIACRGRDG